MTPTWRKLRLMWGWEAGMCDSYLEESMVGVGLGEGMCDSYLEETTADVGVGGRHV